MVFPVVAINSLAGKEGFAEDKEYNEQIPAIHLFVNQINNSGGINGRKINPIITQFDPTNDANMQALCQQWTQGSPAVFAVVDGIGSLGGGRPALRRPAGSDPADQRLVHHDQLDQPGLALSLVDRPGHDTRAGGGGAVGESSGRLGHGKKVGVVVSDQAPDQDALNDYLLPDLKKVGITPLVETVAGSTDQTAETNTDAQLAVEKFKAAGVQSVIPLLRENVFFPYIAAETAQQYYPQLLLSDYQSTVTVALGLIPIPYEQALNGQEGVTTETLGGFDDNRPESQGGYDPGVRSCYNTWHAYHPKPHCRARRASTSRSRDRFRPGAAPSGSSPRRRRAPART